MDHNICTLNGNSTFPGIGIVIVTTVSFLSSSCQNFSMSERLHRRYSNYCPCQCQSVLTGHCVSGTRDGAEDDTSMVDFPWSISNALRNPCQWWSGKMHLIDNGVHPGKSSVMFFLVFWLKAIEFQESVAPDEEGNFMLKFGAFHTEMSFLRSVGNTTRRSGMHIW